MSCFRRVYLPIKVMKTLVILISVLPCFSWAQTPLERERARFEAEAATALAPVREAYRLRLLAALDSLTKAGQLDAAVEVRAELATISGIKPGNQNAPIAGQKWEWDKGQVIFARDGFVKSSDGGWEARGLVTSWKHLGNGVLILHIDKGRNDQKIALLQFNPTWTEYSGWSFDGTVIATRRKVR